MKTDQIFALVILLLMITTATALGQAPTPPGPGSPPEVPLDGGISALVAGGAALGARYYWKKRKDC